MSRFDQSLILISVINLNDISSKITQHFILNPRQLFKADGFGALLSSVLLSVVLVRYEPVFGMPIPILYFLAGLAVALFLFDLFCYLRIEASISFYLRILAFLNLCYVIISTIFLGIHLDDLTIYGKFYFGIEILIVLYLSYLEFKISRAALV